MATTVLLSVFLHGMTAAPAAAWYSRHVAKPDMPHDCAEKRAVSEMPLRHKEVRVEITGGVPPGFAALADREHGEDSRGGAGALGCSESGRRVACSVSAPRGGTP